MIGQDKIRDQNQTESHSKYIYLEMCPNIAPTSQQRAAKEICFAGKKKRNGSVTCSNIQFL